MQPLILFGFVMLIQAKYGFVQFDASHHYAIS